jgi:tyrosyl-tRNA synthetase
MDYPSPSSLTYCSNPTTSSTCMIISAAVSRPEAAIRRMRSTSAFGMVYPLLLNADGTKFGKTEAGAVWLSPERTSPYRFYQFWLNTGDHDVVNRLKIFTFLTEPEINNLAQAVKDLPEQREAQRTLARIMTSLVHGQTALERAEQASQALFGGEITGLSAVEISDIFSDVPSCELSKSQFEGRGLSVLDLLVVANISKSKGDARRSIQEGGIYLNNVRVSDASQSVDVNSVLEGEFIILRKGRKNYTLVRVF